MLKCSIIHSKLQKKKASRLKREKKNSTKDSNESKIIFNKENNKMKKELNSKNCLINESQLKPRQTTDEFIFKFSQKENLNKIKMIKNDKINDKKTTSKTAKDHFKKKKKYIFHI